MFHYRGITEFYNNTVTCGQNTDLLILIANLSKFFFGGRGYKNTSFHLSCHWCLSWIGCQIPLSIHKSIFNILRWLFARLDYFNMDSQKLLSWSQFKKIGYSLIDALELNYRCLSLLIKLCFSGKGSNIKAISKTFSGKFYIMYL